jgi:hypothetical protein
MLKNGFYQKKLKYKNNKSLNIKTIKIFYQKSASLHFPLFDRILRKTNFVVLDQK